MRLKDEAKKITKEKGMFTPVQAAKFLDYSKAALSKWRSNGEGPAYYKGKGGLVFYAREDLIAFKKKVSIVRVIPKPRKTSPAPAPATIPA